MSNYLFHRSKHIVKRISFFIIVALFFFLECSDRNSKFHPISYFPVQSGNTWVFDGGIHKMQITDSGKSQDFVTFSYFDTSDVLLWQESYRMRKNQLYWQTFTPNTPVLPKVSFDPPLPFAPVSAKEGQTLILESIETQSDSTKRMTKIMVEYEIQAIEDVKVKAGTFLNCIKMKINVQYPQSVRRPFFIGEQYWWYAPTIGPVKYDLPSAVGELVDMDLHRNRLSDLP